jgi:hypothetical protein
MEPSHRVFYKSRNCFPTFDPQFLELLTEVRAVPTPASNYFQSVRRWRNLRVSLHSSRRGLHLGTIDSLIRPLVRHQLTDFSSAPARAFFSGELPPLFFMVFLRISRKSQSNPSRQPYPSPPSLLPLHAPFPLRGDGNVAPTPLARSPRLPTHDRAPPAPPRGRSNGLSPSPCHGCYRREMEGGRRWNFYREDPGILFKCAQTFDWLHIQYLLRYRSDLLRSSHVRFVIKLTTC